MDPAGERDVVARLAGLDRDNLALVLAAVSHAGGSHEHGPIAILFDDAGPPYRNPDRERPGPLYPWSQGTPGTA